jgi:hypothetical protein
MSIKTFFEQVPLTKVEALIAEQQLTNDAKAKLSKKEKDAQNEKKSPREKSSGGGRIV